MERRAKRAGTAVRGAAAALLALGPAEAWAGPGLGSAGSQIFQQGGGGFPGDPESQVNSSCLGDHLGEVLASGDFNCDGHQDLAIAAPSEDDACLPYEAGMYGEVYVLYGTGSGLSTAAAQVLQKQPRLPTAFGTAMAAGDFDGNGCSDLAVGAPGTFEASPIAGREGGGSVSIFSGGPGGLTHFFEYDQDTGAIPGAVELDDQFGAALASGDFDNDGNDDLAIGVPGEDGFSGAIVVLYGHNDGPGGRADGLITARSELVDQNSDYMPGGREGWDRFGASLASADFNDDGHDDLAVGVPGEDDQAGAVAVLYGWTNGLRPENAPPGPNQENLSSPLFQQGAGPWDGAYGALVDEAEGTLFYPDLNADQFGAELTTGDFNGDGYADLAIGVPGEEISGGPSNSGAVHVLYGWATGLLPWNGPGWWEGAATGNQLMPGPPSRDGRFGSALAGADFDLDGIEDLVVGLPTWDDLQGEVWVVRGTTQDGLLLANRTTWSQSQTGSGGSEADDHFGAAVETGDFDGDGAPDLAVGVPAEDQWVGAVNVLYNAGDATPPEIVPVIEGADLDQGWIPVTPSADGWYNRTIRVSWEVSDPESAVTSTGCGATTVAADTAGTAVTCSATSTGGTSTRSVTIKRDTVAPLVAPQLTPSPSPAGWNQSAVTVSFICTDALSGVGSCAPPATLPNQGADQRLVGFASDRAGNSANVPVSVSIDLTPPALVAGGPYSVPEGNAVLLDGSGSRDDLSGLVELVWFRTAGLPFPGEAPLLGPDPAELRGEDDGSVAVTLVGTDAAGLFSQASTTVEVLNVAPTVDAGADLEIAPGETIRLEGRFDDPGALDTHTIHWDLGDGSSAEGSLTPEHAWSAPGVYTVRLSVTDDDGGTGSDELSVSVGCLGAFTETFEAYAPGARPAGWTDYRRYHPRPAGAFRTARDADEIHYESRRERSSSEYRSDEARLWRDYDYAGRFALTEPAREGVGLFAYADLAAGRGYLVHVEAPRHRHREGRARLYALRGPGHTELLAQVSFAPERLGWHAFRVRVEEEAHGVRVRARLWHAETDEPEEWSLDALDPHPPEYAGGVGVYARNRGVRFDDLRVEPLSPDSGVSGDRDGDGVCDAADVCPSVADPDQLDTDGDGIGDACESCEEAALPPLCLVTSPPAGGLWLRGDAELLDEGGRCPAGAVRLGRGGVLHAVTPPVPERGTYSMQLRVRADRSFGGRRHGSGGLLVWLGRRPLRLDMQRDAPEGEWWWTEPVRVHLRGGAHELAVGSIGRWPIDVEAVHLQPSFGCDEEHDCREHHHGGRDGDAEHRGRR